MTARLRVIDGGSKKGFCLTGPGRPKNGSSDTAADRGKYEIFHAAAPGNVVRPPEWWWSRHDPDWSVIDAWLAGTGAIRPRLRVVR